LSKNEDKIHGYGQIIVDLKVGENWGDIDFCSKWCYGYGQTPDINNFIVCRDFKKSLLMNHFYVGDSASICSNI